MDIPATQAIVTCLMFLLATSFGEWSLLCLNEVIVQGEMRLPEWSRKPWNLNCSQLVCTYKYWLPHKLYFHRCHHHYTFQSLNDHNFNTIYNTSFYILIDMCFFQYITRCIKILSEIVVSIFMHRKCHHGHCKTYEVYIPTVFKVALSSRYHGYYKACGVYTLIVVTIPMLSWSKMPCLRRMWWGNKLSGFEPMHVAVKLRILPGLSLQEEHLLSLVTFPTTHRLGD
jgi:hypothetical protein